MNFIFYLGSFVILVSLGESFSGADYYNYTSSITFVGPKEQALIDTRDIIRTGTDIIGKYTTVLNHLLYRAATVTTNINNYLATIRFVMSMCPRDDYLKSELYCCLPAKPEVS